MKYESVAGVLFSTDRKRLLLIQRRDVPVWVLPGGGIDLDESGEEAAVREFFEETGLVVTAERLIGSYRPLNRLARPTLLYEMRKISGELQITPETRGVRFFPLKALPQMPPPYPDWVMDAQIPSQKPFERILHSVTYASFARHAVCHPWLVLRFLLARVGFPLNTGSAHEHPTSCHDSAPPDNG